MSFLKKALLASFALMQGAYSLLDSGSSSNLAVYWGMSSIATFQILVGTNKIQARVIWIHLFRGSAKRVSLILLRHHLHDKDLADNI